MDRLEKIAKIAKHYSKKISGLHCGDLTIEIDIVDKMHNLDLDFMLADLDSFDVAHDVLGIWRNLDKKTKKLTGHWVPRFGRDLEEIQDAQTMNDRFEKIGIIAKYFIERYPEMSGQSQMTIEQEGASPLSLIMDIECVDKMHNLDLDRMLDDLDSFHVQHDVIGIWKHLDRKTKKLRDCWLPRFGQDWEETQDAQSWEHDKSLN